MPAMLRVVLLVSGSLGEMSAHLGQAAKVGVELESDHALVLTVVITEDIAPIRQRQRVDGPTVVEVERHADQQIGDRVDDTLDRQDLCAAPEGAVEALDERRTLQPIHGPVKLLAESTPAA